MNLPRALLLYGLLIISALPARAADWPRFRGNDLMATSSDPLRTNWAGLKPGFLWTTNVGNLGSVVVSEGMAYFLGGTSCNAVKAGSGVCLWSTNFLGGGSYSTPVIFEGRLYAYMPSGLYCLQALTGKTLWKQPLSNNEGSQSPWIEEGRVFVSDRARTNSIKAFDATTGVLLWQSQAIAHTYGSPVGATLHGVRQIIFPTYDGVVAVAPDTGKKLWNYTTSLMSNAGPSPAAYGNVVLIGTKTMALKINYTNGVFKAKPIWTNSCQGGYYTTVVSNNGCAFISAGEYLCCREIETGHLNWETNLGAGTIILAEGHLLHTGFDSSLKLAEPAPDRYREICRCPPVNGITTPIISDYQKYLNSPAFANGYLFISTCGATSCVDLDPQPAVALTLTATNQVAQLNVRPVNGWDLAKSRATNLVLLCTTNPALPLSEWTSAGAMTWKNGTLTKRLVLGSEEPACYYQITTQAH